MKKESFQAMLCCLAGIVVAVFIIGCMFKNLHWPGGDLLLSIITPALLLIQAVCLGCYVGKHGALKNISGPAKPYAMHLLRTEVAAIISIAILIIAIIFRVCHWPGGAQILIVACLSLTVLSILAGIFACRLYAKK